MAEEESHHERSGLGGGPQLCDVEDGVQRTRRGIEGHECVHRALKSEDRAGEDRWTKERKQRT